MNARAVKTVSVPASLTVVAALAQLLQRLELSPVPVAADQYRSVVQRLTQALREAQPGEALEALLGTFPAAAELYENLNYEHAGLCRSPLEASLNAELAARQAIARIAR
jgi:2-methylisocitrate lyase-like PEP mutase family enzyme